jgi:hypothetical protein
MLNNNKNINNSFRWPLRKIIYLAFLSPLLPVAILVIMCIGEHYRAGVNNYYALIMNNILPFIIAEIISMISMMSVCYILYNIYVVIDLNGIEVITLGRTTRRINNTDIKCIKIKKHVIVIDVINNLPIKTNTWLTNGDMKIVDYIRSNYQLYIQK